MNDRVELWCEGLPHVGDRRLEAAELGALRTRVETQQRRRRWRHRGLLTVNAIAVALTVGFVLWNFGDQPLGLTLAASLGVMLLALSVLGAVYGAILAETPLGRWVLRAALVGLALPEAALGPVLIVLGLGGAAALWRGWKEWRRLRPSFAVVEHDLAEGTVLRFELEPEPEPEASSGAPADPQPLTIEVLPRSCLLHTVQGTPVPDWSPVELQRIVTPRDPDDHWPSQPHSDHQRADPSHTYRERPLTLVEQDELRRLRRRLIKRIVVETLTLTLATAMLASLLGRLARLVELPGLPLAFWVVAGAVLVWRMWGHATDASRLGRDLVIGRVLRAWSTGADLRDEPSVEFLPCSKIKWTENGKPSGWRTHSVPYE